MTLTAERLRELFSYDPTTGLFTRLIRASYAMPGSVLDPRRCRGYLRVRVDGKEYAAHRLAWLYVYGVWPTGQIDHIDGVRDNNQIDNLRDVPQSLNQQNRSRPRRDNKTGLMGVCQQGNRFVAQITVNGEGVYLGSYRSAEDAHAAYVEAKRRLHSSPT